MTVGYSLMGVKKWSSFQPDPSHSLSVGCHIAPRDKNKSLHLFLCALEIYSFYWRKAPSLLKAVFIFYASVSQS